MKKVYKVIILIVLLGAAAMNFTNSSKKQDRESPASRLSSVPESGTDIFKENLKEIWFAGGCFWGVQKFFDGIYGVYSTTVGYANGKTESTSYKQLHDTGHAETVHITYNGTKVKLEDLLKYLFLIINPTSLNKQGNDVGTQYRAGIYYKDENDKEIINSFIEKEQQKYDKPIIVEVIPLANYILAEDYHQKYLDKNPYGYCHVDLSLLPKTRPVIGPDLYTKPI